MHLKSKFPDMKTTIFSQVSALASKHQAINLGQGFPNFKPNSYLLEQVNYYTQKGFNQYAPMQGMPQLRQSIRAIHQKFYQQNINETEEVTVTSGATEAIFCAISAIIQKDDQVIVFDPSYDSYVPNIQLNGGIPIRLNLQENFEIDWELLKSSITTKTKAIIINSPHNPSGKCLTKNDLDQLWDIIKNHNIFIISDEVYQHIIFDNHKHISPFNDERFRERTFAISSFGKSFHVTGWKIGYCLAAPKLTSEFRKIHQYITFSTFAATQLALSDTINNKPETLEGLSLFYQKKRNFFIKELEKTQFKILPTEGSYFQIVDYSEIENCDDFSFCCKLIEKYKVAAIPLDIFYARPPKQTLIRFCFAKENETLEASFTHFPM